MESRKLRWNFWVNGCNLNGLAVNWGPCPSLQSLFRVILGFSIWTSGNNVHDPRHETRFLTSILKGHMYVSSNFRQRKIYFTVQTVWKEKWLGKGTSIRVTIVPGSRPLSQKMERCGDRGHVGNGQEKSVPFLSSSHSKRGGGDPREDSTLVIGTATSLRFPIIILVILAIPAVIGATTQCLLISKIQGCSFQ